MAYFFTIQSRSGGVGSNAYDCYLSVDPATCKPKLVAWQDLHAVWRSWNKQENSDKFNMKNFKMQQFLIVNTGFAGQSPSLLLDNSSSGNSGRWRLDPDNLPANDGGTCNIGFLTQTGSPGVDPNDCYLSVHPNDTSYQTFHFTSGKNTTATGSGVWKVTRHKLHI